MIIVGKPPVDPDAPAKPKTEKKFKSKVVYNTEPVEEKENDTKSNIPNREDYIRPRIIITEDPPTIQKIKNYFQRKAEKYFIFAICVLLIDYVINTFGEGKRPSKTFTIFSSFAVAAVILLLTWNYITYVPPSKTSKCRYNAMCTSTTCNLNKIRKAENITKEKCSKCSSPLGLAYRCRNCNEPFAYDEVKSRKELKAKIIKDAKIKAKWSGKKVKIKTTLFNSRIIKKCPKCHSEDVYYVTVKQAEKDAEQAAIEKELRETDKKATAKKNKKKTKKK
jgi:hypothetical protein